jgi:hypothetical protein
MAPAPRKTVAKRSLSPAGPEKNIRERKNIFNPADIELSPAGCFFVMELEN